MKNEKPIKTLIQLADVSVKSPFIDRSSKTWVKFGGNNLFPNQLLELVKSSPIQSSILESLFTYSMGSGLDDWETEIYTPNLNYDWYELIKRAMKDYIYFGAFSIQATLNEDGKTYTYWHQPVDQVRLSNYDSTNTITTAYLNADWKTATPTNTIEIKMFGAESPKLGEKYLMYFKDYNPDQLYYAIPSYYSAGNWILCDSLLSKYYANTVSNGFTPSTAILYPNEMDNEKKEALYEMLQENFVGVENAANIMIFFGENGTLPDIKPLNASNNADLYKDFSIEVMNKIISANRLTSPTLVGLATPSGFSSKADEMIAAYTLYKLTVVYSIRKFVLDKINYLLKLNRFPAVLNLIDFDIKSEMEGKTRENEEKQKEGLDVEDEPTDEEKEDVADEVEEENKVD